MTDKPGRMARIHEAVGRRQLDAMSQQPETLGAVASSALVAGVLIGLAVAAALLLAVIVLRGGGHEHG